MKAPQTQRTNSLQIARDYSYQPDEFPINLVRSQTGNGVYASGGPLYKNAIFGRDSLEVAEDLLEQDQNLAREVIITLASLQGVEYNSESEEEPGRIHHEYRARVVDGEPITGAPLTIFKHLGALWGGDEESLLYYGSIDATPLFVRLVYEYVQKYGRKILSVEYQAQDNQTRTIEDSVYAALSWIQNRIEASGSGLLVFKCQNPVGVLNQTWKDSATAYLHEDGTVAQGAIASIEVQGYAYDALLMGIELLDVPASRQDRWRQLAEHLQQQVLEKFWLEEKAYFAMGLDLAYQNPDEYRPIATLTTNPGLLLNTSIFEDLPAEEREQYVAAIADIILSDEFMTEVGVRCRAKSHCNLIEFADYHGSFAVWPKATFDIAQGLRRYGYREEAQALEAKIINSVLLSGGFYELFYVTEAGKVSYRYADSDKQRQEAIILSTTNVPEEPQAWTISAFLAALHLRQQAEDSQTTAELVDDLDAIKSILASHPPFVLSSLDKLLDYKHRCIEHGDHTHLDPSYP